jgi:2-polyprenyl-6-methoxyphenol hydroxylase-like FAD-dependent oxidoreductase
VTSEVEAAGCLHPSEGTVLWAGHLDRRKEQGQFLIDRTVFDSVLLQAAKGAGSVVFQPGRSVDCAYAKHWSIQLDTGELLSSRFLAATTGRSRLLHGAKKVIGTQTIALYANWSNDRTEDAHTLIEAGLTKWYWGAQLPGGSFNATVFVNREDADKRRYLELIRESRLLSKRLEHANCGEVQACDATALLDELPITHCSIKAGDSAITIEPLSSQGVQTAIGSALHAAVVMNTILDRPGDSDLAMDFYRRRLVASAGFHARTAAQLYKEQNAFAPNPFWEQRAGHYSAREQTQKPPIQSLSGSIQLSPFVSFVPLAIAGEQYIFRADGVQLNGEQFGYLGSHNLANLLRMTATPLTAKDAIDRWSATMPSSTALQVFEFAWASGLIQSTE